MAMSKTTLYLPAELQRRLRDASRRTGRPQAELVREALEGYLGKLPRPLPRFIGIVADGRHSGQDIEAWLDEEWGKRR